MRIIRFAPHSDTGFGTDPHYGVINEKNEILVLKGDPIYAGIVPSESKINLDQVRVLAPVLPRSKVVCIGKNYADHAKEMGGEVPEEPIIFIKPNTSVIGPDDVIQWPSMASRVDHEAELAVVIGRICKDVPKEKATDVIFGYTLANDITARDLQQKDGQFISPQEALTKIQDISVQLDPGDPRQIFINIKVMAKSGAIVEESFAITR